MLHNKMWKVIAILVILTMALAACGGSQPVAEEPAVEEPAAEEPAVEEPAVGGFEIPAVEEGKFNIAMVLIGPHDDGGWSQAHYDGLLYVEENVDNTHVAFIELGSEGIRPDHWDILRLYGSHGNCRYRFPGCDVYPPHRLQDQRNQLREYVW